MQHPNVDLVQRLYAAYVAGDVETVAAAFAPDVRWHNSGFDPTAGTREGVEDVLAYLVGENHVEEYALEIIDMLASDERVAVIARSSGRRGEQRLVNDFVQVIRLEGGLVREVWNYFWDQRAVAEFMAVAA